MQETYLSSERTDLEPKDQTSEENTLGKFFSITKKSKETHFSDYETIPFIPMESIPIDSMFIGHFELRNREDISSGTYFEPGDILLAKITPSFENGKQGIVRELPTPFGIATTEVIPMKAIEGISDKYFLFYFLLKHDVRSILASKMEGSTGRQRLSTTVLTRLKVNFPSLPEQRAIAHILQTVQQAIQARRKELELELEHKAALMQHLFTHSTRNEATKQSEVGEMPESWAIVRLGDKLTVRYGLGQPPQWDDKGVPMVRATDIKNGHIVTKTVRRVKFEAIPKDRVHFLKKGDIIVVRSGAYAGDLAIYDDEWDMAIAGYDLIISPIDNSINSNFLTYYLLGEANQRYFKSKSDRSAQPHINADQLNNTVIPLPLENEQAEIAQLLQACDTKVTALEKEIILHEELFRTLLDELMTGRISTLPLTEQLEREMLTNEQRT